MPRPRRRISTVVRATQDKRIWAVEILSLALSHSATRQAYIDKATRLLAELEVELPQEIWVTARVRGQANIAAPEKESLVDRAWNAIAASLRLLTGQAPGSSQAAR